MVDIVSLDLSVVDIVSLDLSGVSVLLFVVVKLGVGVKGQDAEVAGVGEPPGEMPRLNMVPSNKTILRIEFFPLLKSRI